MVAQTNKQTGVAICQKQVGDLTSLADAVWGGWSVGNQNANVLIEQVLNKFHI